MKPPLLKTFSLLISLLLLAPPAFSKEPERTSLPIIEDDFAKNVRHKKMDLSQIVQIGLRENDDQVSIQYEGPIVYSTTSSAEGKIIPAGKYMVTARGGTLYIDGTKVAKRVWFKASRPDDFIGTNGMEVRGLLRARASSPDKVTLVNELSVDDYLRGVLPREVIVSWPMEALKAQAVASRTYLVTHLGRHNNLGFDLCDKVHCQVYGGKSRENSRTNEAVEETRGEILIHNKKPVATFFHANCGGATDTAAAVWGSSSQPYLQVRKCKWDRGAPWFKWNLVLTASEIFAGLKKAGHIKGSRLEKLRVAKKSDSGRVQTMSAETNEGTFTFSGNTFRMTFGPEKVRSMLWDDFSKRGSSYHFSGRGWGHGIGLCQWGAKGQADEGWNYKKILFYYYPGTDLQIWRR